MFKIYDGREDFYQWDLDRKLIVEDSSITQVHFCNRMAQCSVIRYVYELNGLHLVDVPNLLLQNAFTMNVYGYDKNHTRHDERFKVIARSRPEDYIYTDEEIQTWEVLAARIGYIEENGVNPTVIETAVKDYMEANPVEAGATAEEAAQIEANKTDIAEIKADYATKTYVDEAVAAIDVPEADLSDYATKTYVDEAVKNVEVDLSDYATKQYANNAQATNQSWVKLNYYNKTETDSAINAAKPDLSEYVTTQYLTQNYFNKGMVNTAIENVVSGFYTKTEVDNQIDAKLAAIGVAEEGAY